MSSFGHIPVSIVTGGSDMKNFCVCVAVMAILVCLCARPIFAESAEEWSVKGREAYRAQNYEEAEKCYSKALEIDPKMQKALFNRALNFYHWKKYTEARSNFSAVLDIDPKDHEALFYIGLTHLDQGKHSEAYNAFDKASDIERLPLYVFYAGAARHSMGKLFAAIQHYKMALRLNPDDEIKAKANNLITKAEERLKEDKEKRIADSKSSVRVDDQRPKRIVEVKWIQTPDASGQTAPSGGG